MDHLGTGRLRLRVGVRLSECMSWWAWLHHPPKGITGLCENGLIDIVKVAAGVAVEGLGGPRPTTCVRLTGCVRVYTSLVGRGRRDVRC